MKKKNKLLFLLGIVIFALLISLGKTSASRQSVETNNSDEAINPLAFVSCGVAGFTSPTNFSIGTNPFSISSGDFNNDGIVDLVTPNFNADTVSIFLGNSGGFSTPTTLPTGASPRQVSVADFDRDGTQDLAVANRNSTFVSLFLSSQNVPTIFFNGPTNVDIGSGGISIASGDFNRDGIKDLAVATASASVAVLLGDGGGGFSTPTNFIPSSAPNFVTLADANNDGNLDIITSSRAGSVSVLLGDGGGSFGPSINTATGQDSAFVTVGELNQDGRIDLVTANLTSGNASVLIGNGTGTFAVTNIVTGANPTSVAIADLNLDGRQDLAITNSLSNNLSFFRGNGNGTFASAINFTTGTTPNSVIAAQIDQNSKLDLIVSNQNSLNFSVLFNTFSSSCVNPQFGALTNFPAGTMPFFGELADFNKDGKLDLAVANFDSSSPTNGVSVLLGSGGSFGAATTFTVTGTGTNGVTAGDFDQDGNLDIAVANRLSDTISVLLGNGAGSFGASTSFAAGLGPREITTTDIDRDGKLDLVVPNINGNTVSLLFGDGAGSFSQPISFSTGTNPNFAAVADLDNDGDLDLVVSNENSNDISVLLNNGEGFNSNSFPTGAIPTNVVLRDINRDGILDAITANISGTISVLLGDGAGNFLGANNFPAGSSPGQLAVIDINNDGDLDVLAPNQSTNAVTLLLGNGLGGFTSGGAFPVGIGPLEAFAADFNFDGRVDFATANAGGNNVSVRLSTCIGAPNMVLATTGSGQSTAVNTSFATQLQATVFDPNGTQISNFPVQFDTPTAVTSAGATFPGLSTTAVAMTNSSGIALAPVLTANAFVGSYMATASVINDSGIVICTNPGYSLTNTCPIITLSPTGLPSGTLNIPYNQIITASGGTDPYTFSVSSGTLPPGLTLDSSSGTLSGIPTQLGTFNFTITATDSSLCTGMQAYILTISCASISFSPTNLAIGTAGSPYDQVITINGAATPITVSIISGNLPTGLSLIPPGITNNTVRITGSPTDGGSFNFTLQVVDGTGCIATQTYLLIIGCPTLALSPASLPNGQVGVAYTQALTATGGKAPYTFSFVSDDEVPGSLPPGLTVFSNANTGGIVGTPTTTGTFRFSIRARDANNCSVFRSYTLVINGSSTSIGFSVGSLSVTEGGTVAVNVLRTGGTTGTVSVNYSTSNGTAVAGRDFNSASGSLNFVSGGSAPQSFTIQTIANNAFEGNKSFNVNLSSASAGVSLGVSTLTITILEKDQAQPGRLSFSQPNFTVNETAGVASITISRAGGSNVPVSVSFSTSAGANAQAGINYFEASETLTFPVGSTSRTVNISIINDRQSGQDKVVNLLLTGATNGAVVSTSTATLTIIESTPPPNPPVLQTDLRVDFGSVNIGDMAKRIVTLRNSGGQNLTFTPPTVTGNGLSLSTAPSTNILAPNQSTTFEVTLKPAPGSLGSVNGNILISSNGGSNTIPILGQSIDTILPTVTFMNLSGGDILTAGTSFIINYNASDNDALSDFTASFVAEQNVVNPQTGASGGDIARVDSMARQVRWFIPADLESSRVRVMIRARDRAGNVVTIPSGLFSIRRGSNRGPILQTVLNFTAPAQGQIAPPTNLTANATEIRDQAVNQPSEPVLLVQITFDPPPVNQLLPPQNVKVKAGELLDSIAQISKQNKINPKAEGDLVVAGYNVYRVPQPKDGTMPPVDQIVNPNNLVTSLAPDATMFTDKVSTGGSNSGNYTYSVSTFFGNGQMSSGSQPMGTNLPVIINPMFTQGTVFLDSAASFIKLGATLIINDTESYPLQFDDTGTRFTVSKRQTSLGSGATIKRVIGKTSVVKLIVKNPDGITSVGVMFNRKGIVKAITKTGKENINIEPKADVVEIAGYNIYRVEQPKDGRILTPEEIVKPENLIGSVSGNTTSFTDKASSNGSSSGNYTYSVSTFFGNGQMSSGSQPASTDLPVVINPKFEEKNFFVDSAASFIKVGATLIVNDTESYILEFDETGTRFTPRRKTGTPSNQAIDKFIKKGETVRLTIKNPDGKLSVGVVFRRN